MVSQMPPPRRRYPDDETDVYYEDVNVYRDDDDADFYTLPEDYDPDVLVYERLYRFEDDPIRRDQDGRPTK